VKKKDKFWNKIPFFEILLPIICLIIGGTLFFLAVILIDSVNYVLGVIVLLFGIVFFFSGLVLPFFFIGKSFITSVKDLSSKNKTYKISGIIGLILLIVYFITSREYIIGFIPILPIILPFLLIFGGIIFVLISILYLIYRLIKWVYKYILKR